MSSLSAARADNYYYSPDDPQGNSKKKNATNQWEKHGIIRFEMMFSCRCTACENLLAKGTRLNASKKRVGAYLSSPIYSFAMKCPKCAQHLEIESDPANSDFKVTAGLRRVCAVTLPLDTIDRKDPLGDLEHRKRDQIKAKEQEHFLTRVQKRNDAVTKDDYLLNSMLRAKNREKRNREERLVEQGGAAGFAFPLLPESETDKDQASQSFEMERSILPPTVASKTRKRLERLAKDPFLETSISSSTTEIEGVTIIRKRRRRKKKKKERKS